ncbi:unnamed protein product [Candidula unifasciata]|uniref:CUB domain-containing protein n=1 Tax=Candidula unifasciata TaxID=100452 RepID=A0A8S4AAV6_9EUPU|nr:unnamed protein product [Candidula unifasciata]
MIDLVYCLFRLFSAFQLWIQNCGGAFSGPEGGVTSPGYPNPYQHTIQCVWVITVARGSSVQLSFTDLDLEASSSCSHDYLTIRDGSDQRAPTLGTFCNTGVPADIRSSSNVIGLEFHTDELNSGRGFKANWTTVFSDDFNIIIIVSFFYCLIPNFVLPTGPEGCGGVYNNNSGIITSPVDPTEYPHGVNSE